MQNMNELLDFSPDEPDLYIPTLERVDEDEILFAKDLTTREEIRARAKSALELMQHGMVVEDTPESDKSATEVFKEQKALAEVKEKPDVILRLEALMSEYDHEVVQEAVQVRRFIMNRLMEESQIGTKSSERIKALELLGKITEVAAFTERKEITVTHRTTEELEEELEKTLTLLLNPETETYEPAPETVQSFKTIDVKLGK
jgi:predicted RNase H-like HicB family nuclease